MGMIKKSKARRVRIQHGIQKHKINRSSIGSESIFDLAEKFIPEESLQKFYELSQSVFSFFAKFCCRLAVVPLSLRADGKLEVASRAKRHLHLVVLTLIVLSMLHKLVVAVHRLVLAELDVTACLCCISFLIHIVAFSLSFACFFDKEVTVDFVNGWDTVLACFPDPNGNTLSAISNIKSATLVTALGLLEITQATVISGLGLAFDSLPFCYLPMAEAMGLLVVNNTGIPRIVWKLVFWPFK